MSTTPEIPTLAEAVAARDELADGLRGVFAKWNEKYPDRAFKMGVMPVMDDVFTEQVELMRGEQ